MNEVKNNSPKRPVIFYYAIVLVVLLALNFLLVPWMSERSVKETGYNEFLSQVSAGNVTEVEVQEQNAVIYYKVNVNGREEICKTGTMNDPELVDRLNQANVKFGSVIPQKQSMMDTETYEQIMLNKDQLGDPDPDLCADRKLAVKENGQEHGWRSGQYDVRKEQCKDLCKVIYRYQVF